MSVEADVRKIFKHLPDVFVPEKANGVHATIQIALSGEGASDWIVKIAGGKLEVEEGQADSPAMTLQMAARDYVALTRGEVNPIALFTTGRVKLQGDMGLALKFQQMFNRP
ncbi:MAG: SCP2 sterol-binding domain-containing protein [Anaerolineae bacterium]|nr:SCP2 sterol-binding domain-containing protein [Anaerolineae bacterium]